MGIRNKKYIVRLDREERATGGTGQKRARKGVRKNFLAWCAGPESVGNVR